MDFIVHWYKQLEQLEQMSLKGSLRKSSTLTELSTIQLTVDFVK